MVVNYRRHFRLLILATGALFLASSSDVLDPILTYWAVVGLLHAAALAIALRGPATVGHRVSFMVGAATLSTLSAHIGLVLASLLHFDRLRESWISIAYTSGSAVGAFAYWSLVWGCWMSHLAFRNVVRTVCFCVAATLISIATLNFITPSGGVSDWGLRQLPTILWWAAFSFSLFMADRSHWLTSR